MSKPIVGVLCEVICLSYETNRAVEIFVVYRRKFMKLLNPVDPAGGCGSLVCA